MNISILKWIFVLCLFTLSAACSDNDHERPVAAKTFVLVHGAFQGAYAWQYVKTQLEKEGQKVVVVELPAHGDDQTPPAQVSLQLYTDKVINAIKPLSGKVILVGHSMGGMVITSAAEQLTDRIERLIYIAAFVPLNGQSLYELSSTDSSSLLPAALVPSQDGLTLDIKPERIVPVFAQDANAEVQKLLLDKRRPEPAKIFPDKATVTTGNWGRLEKYYVFTKRDNTVGPNLQKRMVNAAKITQTTTIDTDHCPFLTKPELISNILMGFVSR